MSKSKDSKENASFSCEICKKRFIWKIWLEKHIKTKHENPTPVIKSPQHFRCDICQKICSSRNNLLSHMKFHMEKKYACETCGTSFHALNVLKNHISSVHLRERKKCEHCEKEFPLQGLGPHIKAVHLKERKYSCDSCDKTFSNLSNLKLHIIGVHLKKRKVYTCDLCKKTFNWKPEVEPHMNNVHLIDSIKKNRAYAKCRYCPRYFLKTTMEDHIEKNHKKMQCKVCDKVYYNKDAFKQHKYTHNEPKHKCEICNTSFKILSSLKKHLQHIHLKETAKCTICGAVTKAKYMQRHMQIVHNDKKKFACDLCDLKSESAKGLKEHISAIHLKERNHACSICEERFAWKNCLRQHYKIHHSEKQMIK